MTPIDKLLPLLDRVKQTAPDKWIACCPAHNDKRPSLSIREVDDGKILLKCWTGCGAAEIVTALGLSVSDLFPETRQDHDYRPEALRKRGPMRAPFSYRDAMQGISHEAEIISLFVEALADGQVLDNGDLERLAQARNRINAALTAAGGAK